MGLSIHGFSQENGVPQDRYQINGLFKNEVGPNLMGTSGVLGMQFTHYFSRHFATEIGAGLFSAGIKFQAYLQALERGKSRLYVGLGAINNFNNTLFSAKDYTVFLPLGMTLFANRRWNISFDLAPAYFSDYDLDFKQGNFGIHGSFKLGYRIALIPFKKREKYIDTDSLQSNED